MYLASYKGLYKCSMSRVSQKVAISVTIPPIKNSSTCIDDKA